MLLSLQFILALTSLLLGLSVLLHKDQDGGLYSVFSGGMQTNFSSSIIAEKNLDRLTVISVE